MSPPLWTKPSLGRVLAYLSALLHVSGREVVCQGLSSDEQLEIYTELEEEHTVYLQCVEHAEGSNLL